jgi:hypothetical protein
MRDVAWLKSNAASATRHGSPWMIMKTCLDDHLNRTNVVVASAQSLNS